MLADTTAEGAANNVYGLITTEYRGRNEACQCSYKYDSKQDDKDGHNASILQQVQRTVCHFYGFVLQRERNQIGNDKGNSCKEDAFTYQFAKDLQSRQPQQSTCSHLLRALCCKRHTQIDVVEDGKHQYKQGDDHIEMSHIAATVIQLVATKHALLGIVVEGRERCKCNIIRNLDCIVPKECLHIITHVADFTLQVGALAFHQE